MNPPRRYFKESDTRVQRITKNGSSMLNMTPLSPTMPEQNDRSGARREIKL
jgi:hypothetical protein